LEERQVAEQRLAIVDGALGSDLANGGIDAGEQCDKAGVASPNLMRPFPVGDTA
jgi:hypothetical protein